MIRFDPKDEKLMKHAYAMRLTEPSPASKLADPFRVSRGFVRGSSDPARRLFIDSGKKHPGFAWYVGATLAGVGETGPAHDWADEVYYELPAYNRNKKGSPQSLIILAAAGGVAAGRHAAPGAYVGAIDVNWKGNVPKSICRERLLAALSDGERMCLAASIADVPKGKQHDLYDAAYMGLKWLQGKGLRK